MAAINLRRDNLRRDKAAEIVVGAATEFCSICLTLAQTRAQAAEAVNAQAVVDEASARAAAVSAEQQRAEAAEQSLQTQITSLLSNVDPTLVDSISELLSHVNAQDQTLIQSIATLQSEHDDLKNRFDELVNSS